MTTPILAWSSTEYIGQTNLQFPAQDPPGRSRPSEINGDVTATLISNTNISGIPVLVSELHIIADQASTVTCINTNSGAMSQVFNISGMYVHCMDLY